MISDESLKRKADQLSPPVNEVQKRYLWDQESILRQNKFHLLSHLDRQVSGENPTNSQTTPTVTSTVKIPPIFLHDAQNYQEVITDIKKIVKESFTTTYKVNNLRINLTNAEDYRNLTKYYNEHKLKFYTYQNPESRPLSVVIKNVPLSLTNEDIEEELKLKKLPVQKITRLLNKEKHPLPIVVVDLTPEEDAKEILNLNRLAYAVVTVEQRRKTQNIPQCYRCQRYGHTKNYCQLEYRCVKCLGNHFYKDCPKNPNTPPTCVNCGEHHSANFRGCKSYIELKQAQSRNHRINVQPSTANSSSTRKLFNYAPVDPTKTYANATSQLPNQTPSTSPTASSETSLLNKILNFILNLITPHLQQIKTFLLNHIIPNLFNGS